MRITSAATIFALFVAAASATPAAPEAAPLAPIGVSEAPALILIGDDGRWRERDFEDLDDDDVEDYLDDLGYYDVDVDEDRYGFRARGCRDGLYYGLLVDFDGEIYDRERIGQCDDRERVSVDAPGVDVDVGGGVSIRTPGGVDIDIP